MPDWLVQFLDGPGADVLAAASGFFGSLVLLWASRRSMSLRRAQLKAEALDSNDPTMQEVPQSSQGS